MCVCGVTESLFLGPKGGQTFVEAWGEGGGGGGLEDGITIIVSPSHLLCTIKIQMGGQWEGPWREWGAMLPCPIVTPLCVCNMVRTMW